MSAETVTVEQQEALMDFMESHKELALGRFSRTKEGRSLSKRMWTECSNILNSVSANCPTRGPEAWRTYFADYKSKTLRKIKQNKQELSATGGGQFSQKTLTPIQERLFNILGRDVGEPLAGVRHNPLDMTIETNDGEMPWDILTTIVMDDSAEMITTSAEMLPTSAEMVPTSAEMATTSAETLSADVVARSAEMATTIPPRRVEEPPRRRRRRHNREEPEQTPLQAAEHRLVQLETQSADATFALARAIEHLASSIDEHNRRRFPVEIMSDHSNQSRRRRRRRRHPSTSESE